MGVSCYEIIVEFDNRDDPQVEEALELLRLRGLIRSWEYFYGYRYGI